MKSSINEAETSTRSVQTSKSVTDKEYEADSKETENEVTLTSKKNEDDMKTEEICSLNLSVDDSSLDMISFPTGLANGVDVFVEMLFNFQRLSTDPNFLELVSVER